MTDDNEFQKAVAKEAFKLWCMDVWESPIEQKMAVALGACASLPSFSPTFIFKCDMDLAELEADIKKLAKEKSEPILAILPQKNLGKYRVDFLIVATHPARPYYHQIVIECDGHAFHEKTKEQVARDKKRDRDLTKMGLKVLRFSGSEINKDACACAIEAYETIIMGEGIK